MQISKSILHQKRWRPERTFHLQSFSTSPKTDGTRDDYKLSRKQRRALRLTQEEQSLDPTEKLSNRIQEMKEEAMIQDLDRQEKNPIPWQNLLMYPSRALWRSSPNPPPAHLLDTQAKIIKASERTSKQLKRTWDRIVANHLAISELRERERRNMVNGAGYSANSLAAKQQKGKDRAIKPVYYNPEQSISSLKYRLETNYNITKKVFQAKYRDLDGDLSIAASEGSSVAVGVEEENDEPKKEEIEEKKEVNSPEEKDEPPSMVKEEVDASNDLAQVKKTGCTKSKILMNVVVPSIFLACVIVAIAVLAVRYKNFKKKYPGCKVDHQNWIANGVCQNEGLKYNTAECQFDGGDCDEFNSVYPNCEVENPTWVGDGICNGGDYNSDDCAFDGGDCSEFNENYPNCKVEDPSLVGDGNCDGDDYNVEVCGFDGGDCE